MRNRRQEKSSGSQRTTRVLALVKKCEISEDWSTSQRPVQTGAMETHSEGKSE
jgi:hypothetical protein